MSEPLNFSPEFSAPGQSGLEISEPITLTINQQQKIREVVLETEEYLAKNTKPSRTITQLNDIPITGEAPSAMNASDAGYNRIYTGISIGETRDETTDSTVISVQLLGTNQRKNLKIVSIVEPSSTVRTKYFEVLSMKDDKPLGLINFEDLALLLDSLIPNKKGQIAQLADPRRDVSFSDAAANVKSLLEPIAHGQVIQTEYSTHEIQVSSIKDTPYFGEAEITLRSYKAIEHKKPQNDAFSLHLTIRTNFDVWDNKVTQQLDIFMNINPVIRNKRHKPKLQNPSTEMTITLSSPTLDEELLQNLMINTQQSLKPKQILELEQSLDPVEIVQTAVEQLLNSRVTT